MNLNGSFVAHNLAQFSREKKKKETTVYSKKKKKKRENIDRDEIKFDLPN